MENFKQPMYLISPDGFATDPDQSFNELSSLVKHFNEWKERFKHQGYYSSNKGRIPLEQLDCHMKISVDPFEFGEGTNLKSIKL